MITIHFGQIPIQNNLQHRFMNFVVVRHSRGTSDLFKSCGEKRRVNTGLNEKKHTCVLYAIYKGSMYKDVPLNSFVHRLI